MKKIWQTCKAYPIAIVFFVFLMGFSVLDALWPKRAHSELENRDLAQKPAFSIASVVSKQNPWMVQYEAYVKDQIAFRDGWIDLKSYAEAALLKTENNDVYYGEDGYLFKQLLGVDESRFARNVTALANLCERHPGMVDVMIVPSASLVLKDKLPANAPGLDENAHLDEIYAAAQAAGGNPYDMREVLGAHADEYIYYRTDHHWTSYGAYLGYTALAKPLNFKAVSHDMFNIEHVANDFLGTLYSKALCHEDFADTIDLYTYSQGDPVNEVVRYMGKNTQTYSSIFFRENLEGKDKYTVFLGQNTPVVKINTNVKNGKKLIVFKDSYANSMMQFLTLHYEQITVVDLRYLNMPLSEYDVDMNDYQQALFLYNVGTFTGDQSMRKLAGC